MDKENSKRFTWYINMFILGGFFLGTAFGHSIPKFVDVNPNAVVLICTTISFAFFRLAPRPKR